MIFVINFFLYLLLTFFSNGMDLPSAEIPLAEYKKAVKATLANNFDRGSLIIHSLENFAVTDTYLQRLKEHKKAVTSLLSAPVKESPKKVLFLKKKLVARGAQITDLEEELERIKESFQLKQPLTETLNAPTLLYNLTQGALEGSMREATKQIQSIGRHTEDHESHRIYEELENSIESRAPQADILKWAESLHKRIDAWLSKSNAEMAPSVLVEVYNKNLNEIEHALALLHSIPAGQLYKESIDSIISLQAQTEEIIARKYYALHSASVPYAVFKTVASAFLTRMQRLSSRGALPGRTPELVFEQRIHQLKENQRLVSSLLSVPIEEESLPASIPLIQQLQKWTKKDEQEKKEQEEYLSVALIGYEEWQSITSQESSSESDISSKKEVEKVFSDTDLKDSLPIVTPATSTRKVREVKEEVTEFDDLESDSFFRAFPDKMIPFATFKDDVEATLANSSYTVAQEMKRRVENLAEVEIYQNRLKKTQAQIHFLGGLSIEGDGEHIAELKERLSVHARKIAALEDELAAISLSFKLNGAPGDKHKRKREKFVLKEDVSLMGTSEQSAKRRRKKTPPPTVIDFGLFMEDVQTVLEDDIPSAYTRKAEEGIDSHEFAEFIDLAKTQNKNIMRLIRKVLKNTKPRETVEGIITILQERVVHNKGLLRKEGVISEYLLTQKSKFPDKKPIILEIPPETPGEIIKVEAQPKNEETSASVASIQDPLTIELKERIEGILQTNLPAEFVTNSAKGIPVEELIAWQMKARGQNAQLQAILDTFPAVVEGPLHMLRLQLMGRFLNNCHIDGILNSCISGMLKENAKGNTCSIFQGTNWHIPVNEYEWDSAQFDSVETCLIDYLENKDLSRARPDSSSIKVEKIESTDISSLSVPTHDPTLIRRFLEKTDPSITFDMVVESGKQQYDPTILVCLLGKADRSITLDMIVQLCNQRIEKKFFDGDPCSYTAGQLEEFKRELITQEHLFQDVVINHCHTLEGQDLIEAMSVVNKRLKINKALKDFILKRLTHLSTKNS